MARAWRIEYIGALYHVLSRGNKRRNIVEDDKNRNMFLDIVGEMSQRFEDDLQTAVSIIRLSRGWKKRPQVPIQFTFTPEFPIKVIPSDALPIF